MSEVRGDVEGLPVAEWADTAMETRGRGCGLSVQGMKLYLQRHAEAVEGPRNDQSRPLTPEGAHQAEVMAEWLARQIGRVDIVLTSTFVRAVDTALVMAKALGCQRVPQISWLDPDADVDRAWDAIQANAGDAEEVLVVTHHPLVNDLAEKLTGAKTAEKHVKHASILHIHPEGGLLRWFVTPELIERDESELLDAATGVAEAAVDLVPFVPAVHESLKHPKHAERLAPIRADVADLFQSYFRRQKKKTLRQLQTALHVLGSRNIGNREADDEAKTAAEHVIPQGFQLPLSLTGGMEIDYSKALTAALEAGYDGLALDHDSEQEIAADVVEDYLRDNSLRKLTGGVDQTTVEALRNALADAYESGGSYQDMVDAVTETFDKASSVRAGMIAQTEMNAAYNAGRKQLGIDLGFNEKSWNPDGMACAEICIPNVLQGWIAMDEDFESGDDAPPGHPNCDCSLDVRQASK